MTDQAHINLTMVVKELPPDPFSPRLLPISNEAAAMIDDIIKQARSVIGSRYGIPMDSEDAQ